MDIDKNKRIGLTDEQVKQSREQHGKNVLTPPQRTSLWKLYLDKYRDPIIQILLVAAFVSLILAFIEKNFMETIGIFVAVFLATTVGFYFERDAAKKFNLLTALSEEQPVKVRRNGKVMEIPRHDVVVGDVVLVEVGDEVPADGELIVCNDLQINESAPYGRTGCREIFGRRWRWSLSSQRHPPFYHGDEWQGRVRGYCRGRCYRDW